MGREGDEGVKSKGEQRSCGLGDAPKALQFSVQRLGSRDTRDGTPSSVVEKYLLGEKSPRTGQVAGTLLGMPRAKQKERRGIRESGHARQDTVMFATMQLWKSFGNICL